MLRNIADTYFNDPKLNPASTAHDVRLCQLQCRPDPRRPAAQAGRRKRILNPDVWFENVELIAAQDIGQETVTYVRNIYKYYVAYKLAVEQTGLR